MSTQDERDQAVLRGRDEWESTFDAISDWVCLIDLDSRIVRSNKAGEKLLGIPVEKIIGQLCCQLVHGTEQPIPECPVPKMLQTQRREESELYVPELQRWWLVIADPLRNEQGASIGAVHIVQDITKRKQTEEALRRNSEKLEQMVKERTRKLQEAQEKLLRQEKLAVLGQMAGSVGHELRTPLSTISNAVYYLTMIVPDAEAEVSEYLEIIDSETRSAEKIISDLLDFSRVKSLEQQGIQVEDVIMLLLEKYAPPDSILVTSKLPDGLPSVIADPKHLEQVLLNLFTNAYQAMPQGGMLTISGQLEGDMVSIGVSDTGCGIAPENMNKLFEPLFTTKAKGIGLGLAVCKNLLEANGGSIDIKSEIGKGSVCTIRLPLRKQERHA